VQHYRADCFLQEGIECSATPFCKIVGTRGFIQEHETTCLFIKVQCPKCDSTVIRKIMPTHNCFDCILNRVQKIEKTLDYTLKRYEQQFQCHEKFNHVIKNVKGKMLSLNKRIETILFRSFQED